jgi:hypothetical protein
MHYAHVTLDKFLGAILMPSATEWLDRLGEFESNEELSIPSTIPEFLAGPVRRSETPAVRAAVVEFIVRETRRRDRERREKRDTWLVLFGKLMLAWCVVVWLLWFQVRNLESIIDVFHETTPSWLALLSKLRSWIYFWGPGLPMMALFLCFWLFQNKHRPLQLWSPDDAILLADMLRSLELPVDVVTEASRLLNVKNDNRLRTAVTPRATPILVIGNSLTIENSRVAHHHRVNVRWPRMVTIVASTGLLAMYIGLTLLPLVWMMDTYFKRLGTP